MITIYHNPRCSKSREALSIVEAYATRKGFAVEVVEYLKTPPDVARLKALQHMLGCSTVDMVRRNEEEFAALGLAKADDAMLLQAVAAHPTLLQRPIVVFGERAVIARPPELLNGLLDG